LLFPVNSWAATEFVSTINKASVEDYNTVALWEAAMDDITDTRAATNRARCGNWDNQVTGDIPDATAVTWNAGVDSGVLVHMTNANGGSGGDQYLIYCDTSGECNNLADNDTVTDGTNTFDVAGTPDSVCQLRAEIFNDDGNLTEIATTLGGVTTESYATGFYITAASGERHTGVAGTGVVWDPTSATTNGNSVINMNNSYSIIEWIEIKGFEVQFSGVVQGVGMSDTPDNIIIRNMIIHDSDNGSAARTYTGIRQRGSGLLANNIIYNIHDNCILSSESTESGMDIQNNTVYNCDEENDGDQLIVTSTSGGIFKNNICIQGAGSGACYSYDADMTNDYNASSDATATETNDLNSSSGDPPVAADFVSVTGGSEDLHLVSGAPEIDAGTDLGTTNGVNIDIDGRDRDAEADTWDIGADEFVSGAPSGSTVSELIINIM